MPRFVARRSLAALLGTLTVSGCYRTVPVAPASLGELAAGASVRVYLTPQGTTELEPRLGPATVAVDGAFEGASGGALSLVVSRTTKSFGGEIPWMGEHLTVPAADVARVERRVVDRRRTALAAAGAFVAAAAVVAGLIAQHGAGSGGDTGGGVTPTP